MIMCIPNPNVQCILQYKLLSTAEEDIMFGVRIRNSFVANLFYVFRGQLSVFFSDTG